MNLIEGSKIIILIKMLFVTVFISKIEGSIIKKSHRRSCTLKIQFIIFLKIESMTVGFQCLL